MHVRGGFIFDFITFYIHFSRNSEANAKLMVVGCDFWHHNLTLSSYYSLIDYLMFLRMLPVLLFLLSSRIFYLIYHIKLYHVKLYFFHMPSLHTFRAYEPLIIDH